MSYQVDGVWNTDPATDRLEREREAEQDCMGGDKLAVFSLAGAEASPRPCRPCTGYLQAEARAGEQEILPAGVDRSEGKPAPRQPRDVPESGTRPARHGQRLALLVELPSYFTADIDDYREYLSYFGDNESDWLLNLCGEPGVVRVRMEISGEKDSSVVEVWGSVREAKLIDGSQDEDELAENGRRLMREDGEGCEWCERAEKS